MHCYGNHHEKESKLIFGLKHFLLLMMGVSSKPNPTPNHNQKDALACQQGLMMQLTRGSETRDRVQMKELLS